jgi:hypothetical protein
MAQRDRNRTGKDKSVRKSDENRTMVSADGSYRKKIDALAPKLGISALAEVAADEVGSKTESSELSRHRSAVIRTAIDELHQKHFPAQRHSHRSVSWILFIRQTVTTTARCSLRPYTSRWYSTT